MAWPTLELVPLSSEWPIPPVLRVAGCFLQFSHPIQLWSGLNRGVQTQIGTAFVTLKGAVFWEDTM